MTGGVAGEEMFSDRVLILFSFFCFVGLAEPGMDRSLRHLAKINWTFALGLLAAGFVERSLQIHADMRLALASPAAKIPERKLSNLFLRDALMPCSCGELSSTKSTTGRFGGI
jgi:hypothetical protein